MTRNEQGFLMARPVNITVSTNHLTSIWAFWSPDASSETLPTAPRPATRKQRTCRA
jgi:hypothetical protein